MTKASSARQTQKAASDGAKEKKFTKINGRPTRKDYTRLCKEVQAASTQEYVPYEGAEDNGYLAEILGSVKYTALTGLDYEKPDAKPSSVHPDIDEDTTDEERAELKAEQAELIEAWWARLGWIEGTGHNIRAALDEKYYQQLQHSLLQYKKIEPKEYLDHLANKWCRLSVQVKKEMRETYFAPWCQTMHIAEFARHLQRGREELLEDGITITDENMSQHYMEQINDCGLFTMDQMMHWEDYSEEDRSINEMTTYFEELVDNIEKYKENSRGAASKHGFESAANIQERERVNSMLETMMKRMERTENENDQLREAISGTFSNGERMEEKVDNGKETINNLLEKMNNMERRNEERMTTLMKEHKSELKRARNNNDGGDRGGHRTDGGGDRGSKRSRYNPNFHDRFREKSKVEWCASNVLKWQKRLEEKLDKPGSGWATKRSHHDPDTINWGGYCHSHGYDPIGKAHDSTRCMKKADGHDKTATRTNRKGGSEDNKPL
jgi:hypothetical protein